jgi:hypothetical protein
VHLETAWNKILWDQFGASIDMLDNAMNACPDDLWSDPSKPPAWDHNGIVGFWYLAYHTLFFLDLQLSGPAEGFAPPPPFDRRELDPKGLLPKRPYTKPELETYLRHCRDKCYSILANFTEDQARRVCQYGSLRLTFGELMLYSMRHVQHHAAQLNLLLRQHTGSAPRYVKQAR